MPLGEMTNACRRNDVDHYLKTRIMKNCIYEGKKKTEKIPISLGLMILHLAPVPSYPHKKANPRAASDTTTTGGFLFEKKRPYFKLRSLYELTAI